MAERRQPLPQLLVRVGHSVAAGQRQNGNGMQRAGSSRYGRRCSLPRYRARSSRVHLIGFHRLEAIRTALAAVGAAFASFLHDEAAAECGETALEAAAAALALRRLLLIVHLLLGRVGLLVLLGRVLLGRVLLVVRLQAIAGLVIIGQ